MGILYDNPEYARSRIIETCVLSGGKVYYVHDVEGDTCIVSEPGKPKRSALNYKDLAIDPPTFGYVNVENSCWYVSRMPKRRDWRQGFHHENLVASSVGRPFRSTRDIGYKNLCQPILNQYPKLAACHKNVLNNSRTSQAFSRDFCLSMRQDDGMTSVHYMGCWDIGTYDGSKFHLSDKFKYLKERLERYESR